MSINNINLSLNSNKSNAPSFLGKFKVDVAPKAIGSEQELKALTDFKKDTGEFVLKNIPSKDTLEFSFKKDSATDRKVATISYKKKGFLKGEDLGIKNKDGSTLFLSFEKSGDFSSKDFQTLYQYIVDRFM